jgi:plastocyanin
MVAFFLFPSALADQRQLYQAGFMAPSYASTYATAPQVYTPYAPAAPDMYAQAQYAYPEAYPVYEQEASDSSGWSDVAMLAVAGAIVGAAIGHKTKNGRKVNACGNPYCTCENCGCLSGCQCGKPKKVSMLGVAGTEATLTDKIRNTVLAGLVSVGLMSTPVVANAVDVKLGSDGGQLVFVPDEVTIKAGESVTWLGNKGMPHNVVFDEENVPDGTDLAKLNHEDMINDEGEKVTSKFDKPGTYGYYCEPHRGAGMNATVVVK